MSKVAKYTIIYQIISYGLQENMIKYIYLELTEKKCKKVLKAKLPKTLYQYFIFEMLFILEKNLWSLDFEESFIFIIIPYLLIQILRSIYVSILFKMIQIIMPPPLKPISTNRPLKSETFASLHRLRWKTCFVIPLRHMFVLNSTLGSYTKFGRL